MFRCAIILFWAFYFIFLHYIVLNSGVFSPLFFHRIWFLVLWIFGFFFSCFVVAFYDALPWIWWRFCCPSRSRMRLDSFWPAILYSPRHWTFSLEFRHFNRWFIIRWLWFPRDWISFALLLFFSLAWKDCVGAFHVQDECYWTRVSLSFQKRWDLLRRILRLFVTDKQTKYKLKKLCFGKVGDRLMKGVSLLFCDGSNIVYLHVWTFWRAPLSPRTYHPLVPQCKKTKRCTSKSMLYCWKWLLSYPLDVGSLSGSYPSNLPTARPLGSTQCRPPEW